MTRKAPAILLLLVLTGCASAPCPLTGQRKVVSSRCSAIPGCAGDRITTKICAPDGKWLVTDIVECSCG